MYGFIVRKMIESALRSQAKGDLGPLLSKAADDVHFTFPGESSWAADIHGKANLEPWIKRFMEAGLQFEPQEIVVNGWPWDTLFYIYFTDHGTDDAGNVFYENRGVIRGELAWGRSGRTPCARTRRSGRARRIPRGARRLTLACRFAPRGDKPL